MADEYANLGVALRTYLRESTVLADGSHLGSNQNIFLGYPKDKINKTVVPPYKNYLVIMVGRGGPGELGLAQEGERVDFFCYGQDDNRCKAIARALLNWFQPVGVRRVTSFTRNGCQVSTFQREGGMNTLTDPDAADWPYTLVTYVFVYNQEVRS